MILKVKMYCQFENRDVETDWIFEKDVKLLYTRGCDFICENASCRDCLAESRKKALSLLELRALDVELDLEQP